jgi:hypothetical protein
VKEGFQKPRPVVPYADLGQSWALQKPFSS